MSTLRSVIYHLNKNIFCSDTKYAFIPSMKFLFLACAFTLFQFTIYPQVPVGYVYDLDGTPFYGWYNGFNYQPKKSLRVPMVLDDFIACQAISAKGDTQEIKLRSMGGGIYTSVRDGYGTKKIKPTDYQYIIMGMDSLFSFSGSYRQTDYIKSDNMFLWFLERDDSTEFAMEVTGGDYNPVNYFARRIGSHQWAKLKAGSNNKLKQELLLFMGHIPELKQDILENKYKEKDIPKLIKKLKYFNALKTGEPLPYDHFWKEQKQVTNSENKIRVKGYDGNLWQLELTQNGNIIQSGYFSALTPLIADSLLNFFDDHQQLFKTEFYSNEILDSSHIFNAQGTIAYAIKFKVIDPNAFELKYRKKYSIINTLPVSSIDIYDTLELSIIGETKLCYQKYERAKLTSSYYLEDGKKIYQMVSRDFHPKTGSIQGKLSKFSDTINFASSIKAQAEGHTLLWVRVNEKGKIEQMNTLYTPFEKHDKFIQYFFDSKYKKRPTLGKYKVNNEAVTYEVLLPINFLLTNQSSVYQHYMNPYRDPYFSTPYPGQPNLGPLNYEYQNPSYGIPR